MLALSSSDSGMSHRRRRRSAVPVLQSPGRISSTGPPSRCTHMPTSLAVRDCCKFGTTGKSLIRPIRNRVKPFREKYSPSVFRKFMIISVHPLPSGGDVSRPSRTLEAGCDGRLGVARRATRRRTSEIAWSRSPDAGIKFRVFIPERRRLTSPDSGESAYKP